MIRTTVVSLRIDWDDDLSAHPDEWDFAQDLGVIGFGEGIEIVRIKDYDI